MGIDAALGLDAAAPANVLALLVPQVKRSGAPGVAIAAAVLALALIPVARPGVPVIAAAAVAIAGGLIPRPPTVRSDAVTVASERR